jgi:glycosyltransferase involved in cell wall biosynthesis
MAGGGAERQLVYLSGELVRRGWEVHVALLKEGPNMEGLIATGCTIHKIPARGNYDLTILWHIFKLIRTIRPNFVQTWLTQMDVLAGGAARLAGTPFVLSERSCEHNYAPSFKNNLRIFVGRYASAIVSNSSGGHQYWRRRIGDFVPLQVIHNALPLTDIEKAGQAAGDFPSTGNSKVLLFAGRLSIEKNIFTLIRAFKMVLAHRDAVLLLCGEGELRSQIEGVICAENLTGRAILLGYVNDLWGLMKRADLFISVSHYEGLPNTVLEAIACDCPLLLSDISSHRAFLNEEEAFFADPARTSDVADAISACLENPEKARQRSRKAKADISSFSVEKVTDQFQNFYEQILSRKKPRGY